MFKRIFDFSMATVSIIVLCPAILLIAFLVRVKIGSPLLFTQIRPGLLGKPFTLYKFRTMTDACDPNGIWLPDEDRLTSLGMVLRRMSLDELPSLINVIKGDMSFVGPRPLLMEYLPLYDKTERRRHEVKPGVTGWAQVNGRNSISWKERFKLDVWYVDNQSFLLDMLIFFKTFKKVLAKEGISAEGHATMPFFKGDNGEGNC